MTRGFRGFTVQDLVARGATVSGAAMPDSVQDPRTKPKPPRPRAGDMNKTEARYAEWIELQRMAGKIRWWGFEAIKLRLASGATYYTPDFVIVDNTGAVEFHEVKGFWRDDARVKIKVAADKFSALAVFVVVRLVSGVWEFERIGHPRAVEKHQPRRAENAAT